MNWKEIEISRDWTHFTYQDKPLFGKKFQAVLKFKGRGLAPVLDKTGWHFINPQGDTVIPGPFLEAWGFYCGLSAVKAHSGCYHIDQEGNPAYDSRFSWCGNFQEDFCAVRDKDGNYFHIRKNGERLSQENYKYAGDFKDGLASVMLKNGRFKHIDEKGKFIYDSEFLDLGVYHKGYATARDENGWFHIDLEGRALYEKRYDALEPFYNGVTFGERDGEKVWIDWPG